MRTRVAEWSGILSFVYLLVDSIWKIYMRDNMDMSLVFEVVMFLILVGSLIIVAREKYKAIKQDYETVKSELATIKKWLNEPSLEVYEMWLSQNIDYKHANSGSLERKIGVMLEWWNSRKSVT